MSEQPINTSSTPSKLIVWIPALLSICMVIGILIGLRLKDEKSSLDRMTDGSGSLGQGRIDEVIRYIDAKYVDKVHKDEIIEKTIQTMLRELDPHSVYISAKELSDVNEQLDGNFDGIGVEFMILEDTITVVTPLSGGPSEALGILSGDQIVTIEDSTVAGIHIDVNTITHKLKGPKGSKVKVGIRRSGEKKLKSYTIIRDEIPIHSIDCAYLIDNQTGFIKINRFSATTSQEFMESVDSLVKKGMKDLVIDVRQNPGGYLQEASNVLSQLFKDKGKLLVYTKGRTVPRNDYESTGRAYFDIKNVAVLIDEGSASASEILAGAVQDWDRGVLVGRRTFGKGLVQEQYPLRDGGALRLTVARYYTPSGRCIQRPYDDTDSYEEDVYKRYEDGELTDGHSTIRDSTKYYTGGGRIVYGGGGITPDYFVPLESVVANEYYIVLRQVLPEFSYRYFLNHKSSFTQNFDQFHNEYQVSDGLFNEFITYAAEKGVKKDIKEIPTVKAAVKQLIKARIGKQMFDDTGFFASWNDYDPVVKKALQMMKQKDPLALSKVKKPAIAPKK